MTTPHNQVDDTEDNDLNKQEPHDPVAAGKAAIEAGKIASPQSDAKEEADAEKWRNEG